MLLVIGFLLLGVAAALDIPRWPGRIAGLAWLSCAGAAVLFAIAGARSLADLPSTVDLGSFGVLADARLATDRLSGLFLLLCFGIATLTLLAGTGLIVSQARPRLAAEVALCLASVALILTAQDVFVFVFGWEALTLAFYLLAGHDRGLPGRVRAAMLAGGFGKLSGALVMFGFLLLAAETGSFDLATIPTIPHGAGWCAGYVLLLLGFGVKVGWVPLHVWLPPAYAAAPGPARAVMAAVAVNVGFYGMWRSLQLLGAPPVWLAVIVLLIAGVTAIFGIAHAAVHPDLAHLVAWSSVENAGIITAGYGVALVGAVAGNDELIAVGLLAGFLQVTAHAVGKATLFVATAAVEQEFATTELDALRGVVRRMRWTGVGLVVGSVTLAGLPLTAGFVSEWFTLESLMQQFRVDDTAMRLATAFAGGMVALTVGVAGVTFVRLVALTAFGHPGAPHVVLHRPERRLLLRVGSILLVLVCLGLPIVAPLQVRVIGAGLTPLSGAVDADVPGSLWVLQPVFADFSSLSPTWVSLVLPGMFLVIALLALAASRGRQLRVRRVPAWTSASTGVGRQTQYTSFGYANPMRKVLANLLRTRSELHATMPRSTVGGPLPALATATTPAGVVAAADRAEPSRPTDVAPDDESDPALGYRVGVVEVVERYLYRPLGRALYAVVAQAKRLQSGRLDAYMAYMLIAVVAVLAVVVATV